MAVVAAAFGVVLIVTSFLGVFVRPTSDDYCLMPKTRALGVFGLTSQYYLHENGRIANALASGSVYLGGGFLTKLLPAFLLVTLAVAVGCCVALLWARTGEGRRSVLTASAAVGTATAATICWSARNPYQVVFWAPGSISYLLPGVLFALFTLVVVADRGRHGALLCAVAVAFGLTIGTLSESFALTGATLAGAFLLFHLVQGPRFGPAVRIALATGIGISLGLLILVTSPGAAARRTTTENPLSVGDAVSHARAVFWDVLHLAFTAKMLVPALAIGALLGLLLRPLRLRRSAWNWLVAAALVLPPFMAFEVTIALGYGYGSDGWQFSRAWEGFLIPSVLLLVALSYLFTSQASFRVRSTTVRHLVAIVPLLLLGPVVVNQLRGAQTTTTTVVARAVAWDAQASHVRRAAARGQTTVTYRALPIASLAEPYLRPRGRDYWADCVSQYFGVKEIAPPAG